MKITPCRQAEIDSALVKMIAEDSEPFGLVEHSGFRNFVRCLCSDYVIPSRSTITRQFDEEFTHRVKKVCCSEGYNNTHHFSCLTCVKRQLTHHILQIYGSL